MNSFGKLELISAFVDTGIAPRFCFVPEAQTCLLTRRVECVVLRVWLQACGLLELAELAAQWLRDSVPVFWTAADLLELFR